MSTSLANVTLPNLNGGMEHLVRGLGFSHCVEACFGRLYFEFMCGGMIFPKCVFLRSIKQAGFKLAEQMICFSVLFLLWLSACKTRTAPLIPEQ